MASQCRPSDSLREFCIIPDLKKNGDIDADLHETANPELNGCLVGDEVDRLENVAAGPHQHHRNAERVLG